MDSIKLALSNFLYIATQSDITCIRFVLAMGSILSSMWAFLVLNIEAHSTLTTLLPPIIPLWIWGTLFLIHGIWALKLILLKVPCFGINIACSMLGAILWTGSAIIVTMTQITAGHLPIMLGAHLMTSIVSWWVFINSLNKLGKLNNGI